MRVRLNILLTLLMTSVVVVLGVPLARSVADTRARAVCDDRAADLDRFADLVPADADRVALSVLSDELRRYEEIYGITVALVDTGGTPGLASSEGLDLGSPRIRAAVRAALAGRPSSSPGGLLPWQNTPTVVARPVVTGGDVVAAAVSVSPATKARNLVLRDWTLLALAGIAGLLGAVLAADRLTRWVLGPVEVLDGATQRIAGGDLSARTRTDCGPAELRRLAGSFNHMADQVQAADRAQRAFVADAGHQLRNPLGALLVRLEGLALTCAESDRTAVLRAAHDGRYLAETLDRMLELARAEHTGSVAGPVDVAAVVDDRLAGWQVLAERRGIEVCRRGPANALAWHERNAVAGAFDAVLDNALKYSPAESRITVEVRCSGREDEDPRGVGEGQSGGDRQGEGAREIEVCVADEGPGLEPSELLRFTDRFWRSPRHRGTSGSGLGMAVAGTLLERHGGRLTVAAPGRGLRVCLHLPSAPPSG
ncbi:MAG: histidine kinase [Actinomycetota bacterium]|nr:histidine kinase [Actinomycetota bacterium]